MSFSNSRDPDLLRLIEALTAPPVRKPDPLTGLAALFADAKPAPTSSALLDFFELNQPKAPPLGLFGLGAALAKPNPTAVLSLSQFRAPPRRFAPQTAPTKRKVFFSFHYDDVMRVNNVRKAFEFQQPNRLVPSFYDSSLWESRKLEGDDALRRLIREGVENTSTVCVLVGTNTWARRWVRYEIARAVIDKKGLLAVSINGLNHHKDRVPHAMGHNPLAAMAVGKMRDGTYRLFEWRDGGWYQYADYRLPVSLPVYLPEPQIDYVTPLYRGTALYDYARQNGSKNIGGWIDLAAVRARRR